jgi:lysophospholipase L1-like esterase
MGRIVAFGASTIHGCNDQINGGFVRQLARDYEAAGPGNMLYELGVWGDTLDRMLERTSEVSYRRPERVIVYTGLNDTRRSSFHGAPVLSVPDIISRTEQLLLKLSSFAPLFITALPVNESSTTPYRNSQVYYRMLDVAALNQAQKALCKNMSVPYVDLFNEWSKEPEIYMSDDGLHPNTMAHQELYEAVKASI